jgi:hypothetical protein
MRLLTRDSWRMRGFILRAIGWELRFWRQYGRKPMPSWERAYWRRMLRALVTGRSR